ncbi:PTH2-domain-containing protein [Peniophora sp. CONT]|nr:PTH2-domain-containing protein [Peniophora sp. CONT]
MPTFAESLPPSSLTLAVTVGLASASAGYFFGSRATALRLPEPSQSSQNDSDLSPAAPPLASVPAPVPVPAPAPVESDDSDDEAADGDLSAVSAGFMAPCKLVLVVRTDLGMSSGKIAAQCSHATLACYKALVNKNPKLVKHWERTGQAKIALKCNSEDQLLELEAIAKSLNLCARSIQDAGRTEVAAGSTTVLGIGPAPVELINQVTGKLRLL